MIKEVLELLFIRHLSLSEAARALDISRETLQGRLDMLVHTGYIKGAVMGSEGCSHACKGCALASGGGGEVQPGSCFEGYELTGKGQRLMGI